MVINNRKFISKTLVDEQLADEHRSCSSTKRASRPAPRRDTGVYVPANFLLLPRQTYLNNNIMRYAVVIYERHRYHLSRMSRGLPNWLLFIIIIVIINNVV